MAVKSIIGWSINDVGVWLKDIGLGQYAGSFSRLRIDGRSLSALSGDELGKDGVGLTAEHQALFLEKRADLQAGRYVPGQLSPRSSGTPLVHSSSTRGSPARGPAGRGIQRAPSADYTELPSTQLRRTSFGGANPGSPQARSPGSGPISVPQTSTPVPHSPVSSPLIPSNPSSQMPSEFKPLAATSKAGDVVSPRPQRVPVPKLGLQPAASATDRAPSPTPAPERIPSPVPQASPSSPRGGAVPASPRQGEPISPRNPAAMRVVQSSRAAANPLLPQRSQTPGPLSPRSQAAMARPMTPQPPLAASKAEELARREEAARRRLEAKSTAFAASPVPAVPVQTISAEAAREEAQRRQAEETRRRQEEEARAVAARRQAEAERKKKEYEEQRRRDEAEMRAFEEALYEAEVQKKREEEARIREEQQRQAEVEVAQRRAMEARAERQRRDEEERQQIEERRQAEGRRQQEDDKRRKEEEGRRNVADEVARRERIAAEAAQKEQADAARALKDAAKRAPEAQAKEASEERSSVVQDGVTPGDRPPRPGPSAAKPAAVSAPPVTPLTEPTYEQWKQRALTAEAGFVKLKDKTMELVEKIKAQRLTIEDQNAVIAKLEAQLAEAHKAAGGRPSRGLPTPTVPPLQSPAPAARPQPQGPANVFAPVVTHLPSSQPAPPALAGFSPAAPSPSKPLASPAPASSPSPAASPSPSSAAPSVQPKPAPSPSPSPVPTAPSPQPKPASSPTPIPAAQSPQPKPASSPAPASPQPIKPAAFIAIRGNPQRGGTPGLPSPSPSREASTEGSAPPVPAPASPAVQASVSAPVLKVSEPGTPSVAPPPPVRKTSLTASAPALTPPEAKPVAALGRVTVEDAHEPGMRKSLADLLDEVASPHTWAPVTQAGTSPSTSTELPADAPPRSASGSFKLAQAVASEGRLEKRASSKPLPRAPPRRSTIDGTAPFAEATSPSISVTPSDPPPKPSAPRPALDRILRRSISVPLLSADEARRAFSERPTGMFMDDTALLASGKFKHTPRNSSVRGEAPLALDVVRKVDLVASIDTRQAEKQKLAQVEFMQERISRRSMFKPMGELLPVIHPSEGVPAFTVEKPVENIREMAYRLNVIQDLYRDRYAVEKHMNFIAISKDKGHPFFVTVLELPIEDNYRVLFNTRRGFEELLFRVSDVALMKGNTLQKRLAHYISERHQCTAYHVTSEALSLDIGKVEQKHQQKKSSFLCSIIYAKAGQKDPLQMFKNSASAEFLRFCKVMGFDESQPNKPYRWMNAFEVTYHVAPFMNAEGHRRLIGNDRSIIFFKDAGEPFDPTGVDNLGTMPQVFAVVQPHGPEYRIGFFRRVSIRPFGPFVPKTQLWDATSVCDFLLTKVYNGIVMTMFCPPMNRLFETPRQSTIDEIVAKYPTPKKKSKLGAINDAIGAAGKGLARAWKDKDEGK